jgi:radical SAM protein with 4Fe4S-binding SPASM domain
VIPRARANELTGVLRRNRFDDPPGDITEPADLARWSSFRAAYHRAANLDAPSAFPLQLDFELTSRCNLRCAFCVHGQEEVPNRELDFDRFARAIDEGEQYGLVSTKLNYINEPLLTRDLPRYIRYAKDHGVLNVYFATNGVLLNERVRGALIDAGVSKIMVSLDATTPETFRTMRGSAQFDLIVRNIRGLLVERERRGISYPLVRVNFLKTPLNVHEAEDFVRLWTDVADMIGLQDQVGLPGVDGDLLGSGPYVDHSAFRCSFPFKMLVVDSAGHILPCCTFSGREMPLGHVVDLSLHDAWVGGKMRALRILHAAGDWRKIAVCSHCVLGK